MTNRAIGVGCFDIDLQREGYAVVETASQRYIFQQITRREHLTKSDWHVHLRHSCASIFQAHRSDYGRGRGTWRRSGRRGRGRSLNHGTTTRKNARCGASYRSRCRLVESRRHRRKPPAKYRTRSWPTYVQPGYSLGVSCQVSSEVAVAKDSRPRENPKVTPKQKRFLVESNFPYGISPKCNTVLVAS